MKIPADIEFDRWGRRRVIHSGGHALWTGAVNASAAGSYPVVKLNGDPTRAVVRILWDQEHGAPAPRLSRIVALCQNERCIELSHYAPVSTPGTRKSPQQCMYCESPAITRRTPLCRVRYDARRRGAENRVWVGADDPRCKLIKDVQSVRKGDRV